MAIPKYAFMVERTYRVGPSKHNVERKNYEALAACIPVRDSWLKQPATVLVRVLAVLDETSKEKEPSEQR